MEPGDSLDSVFFIDQNCKKSRGNRPQFVRLNLTQCTVNTSDAFVENGTGHRKFYEFYCHWIIKIQCRLCILNEELDFRAIFLTHTIERLRDANRFIDFILSGRPSVCLSVCLHMQDILSENR
jgi:hypothetical protein